jgi:ribosome-binding protein aMBF1 (putative translation factor)
MKKLVEKSVGSKQTGKASIDHTAYKTMFDDVKDTPEFKRGYEKEMLREFAETIKASRTKKGFSQKKVADEVGTKQQVISRLENGVDDIKLSTFFRVANVLHIDLDKFVHALRR